MRAYASVGLSSRTTASTTSRVPMWSQGNERALRRRRGGLRLRGRRSRRRLPLPPVPDPTRTSRSRRRSTSPRRARASCGMITLVRNTAAQRRFFTLWSGFFTDFGASTRVVKTSSGDTTAPHDDRGSRFFDGANGSDPPTAAMWQGGDDRVRQRPAAVLDAAPDAPQPAGRRRRRLLPGPLGPRPGSGPDQGGHAARRARRPGRDHRRAERRPRGALRADRRRRRARHRQLGRSRTPTATASRTARRTTSWTTACTSPNLDQADLDKDGAGDACDDGRRRRRLEQRRRGAARDEPARRRHRRRRQARPGRRLPARRRRWAPTAAR